MTPEIAELLERLKKLEAEERVDGRDWNDPKTPDAKVKRLLKRAKDIHDLRRQLAKLGRHEID